MAVRSHHNSCIILWIVLEGKKGVAEARTLLIDRGMQGLHLSTHGPFIEKA